MSTFLKRNQNNVLLGTVTSAAVVIVGPLVRLKDCSLSSGTASDESCGVAHVHLLPGAVFPAVGERIACSGRLVNASSVGALLKDAPGLTRPNGGKVLMRPIKASRKQR